MSVASLIGLMDFIRQLNGGTIIPFVSDSKSQMYLPSKDVELYRQSLPQGTKYFYFAFLGDTQNLEEAISEIEKVTITKRNKWCGAEMLSPSDSYMIYFWEVPSICESVNKEIIGIEENEFFYKKYVFYYTGIEYEAFRKWIVHKTEGAATNSIVDLISNTELKTDEMKFLTRLVIKVPCIQIPFEARELPDFEQLVQDNLEGIRTEQNRNVAKSMNQIFLESWTQGLTAEQIVAELEKDIMG